MKYENLGSSWAFRYATTTMGFNPFDYAEPLPGSNREIMRWKLHQPFDIKGHNLSHFITWVAPDDNHLVSDIIPADSTGMFDAYHPLFDNLRMNDDDPHLMRHQHSNPELAHIEAFKDFIKNTRGLLLPEEGR